MTLEIKDKIEEGKKERIQNRNFDWVRVELKRKH